MSLLERLLEVFEAPPETEDIDALLAAWSRVVSARDALTADAPKGLDTNDPAVRAMLMELQARHDRWGVVLAAAKARCGASRVGSAQIRRYQRSGRAAEP
ncbi:MAG: hypothetical protein QM831_13810 [Kofleriaceae bacterium]